jgi:hypothetical protein
MSSQSRLASVEQDAPSKVPMLLPGDITPSVMHMYENACRGYFDTKDVAEDKQVRRILAGLRDNCIQDWVSIHRDHLLAMTFDDFLAEFKTAYLPKDWEEITCIELLQLMQGEDSFWNFSILVQAKNSTLSSMQSHLSEMQLRHRMESGINTTLALRCRLEKVTFTGNLTKWLDDVKCVDGLINTEQANFQALAKKSHETSRCTNSLAEPPCHTNTSTNVPAANRISLPKLTSVERQLLYDNEGCLKCCCVFVPHRSTDCPNDFPNSANYKPLTQSFVDMIKRRVKKTIAAVTSSSSNKEVAATSALAPVAVVMGMLSNPTAYTASNLTNVIEGDSLSDESVSKVPERLLAAPTVPPAMCVALMLKASQEDMALLTVPHLYWKCAVNGVV